MTFWKSLLEYVPLQYNVDDMDVNFHNIMVPKLSAHGSPCNSKISYGIHAVQAEMSSGSMSSSSSYLISYM